MFEHELALELGMTVAELRHGRGTPMSAHELMRWQVFFAARKQMQDEEERRRG